MNNEEEKRCPLCAEEMDWTDQQFMPCKCGYQSHMASFFHPFYSSHISEDSGGALLQKRTPLNGFAVDHNPVHNKDDEASLPTRYVNSISNDSCQDLKFRNSAKSDGIYKSSQSFSNEEIVEHLRRIDDDDNLHNYNEKSVLDAVESSIISNILSIDFDSCEDSLPTANGLSEFIDVADGFGGSFWSSLNSDQSGYSFTRQDGFASQMAASVLPEYGDSKELYLCKPQYPVSRAQSLAPPGFSNASRDPPPGFWNSDRASSLPRPSSGGRLSNAASFSSALFQPSSVRHGSSFDDVDFFNRAILPSGEVNQPNGYSNTIFEAMPTCTPGLNTLDDEFRFWLMMQQSTPTHQDPKFSQIYAHQIPFSQRHNVNGMSEVDEMPQQNGHVSNANGHLHSLDKVQHRGESGLAETSEKREITREV